MKTVLITGSTRGIGYGLAREFLARHCQVIICGRSESTLQTAVSELSTNQQIRLGSMEW